MSTYVALSNKYRPKTITDIVGQSAVKRILAASIEQQRIPSAYLFHGGRGTGKTSTARIMAKSLNCLAVDRPTVSPCGDCNNCRSIAISNSLDVIEIDAASNNGVDAVRSLIESVGFSALNSRYRVVIIDECHQLTTQAQNALLKTLEEPPNNVLFILATTEPHRILDTIRSRCQAHNFKKISSSEIAEYLARVAEEEQIEYEPEALRAIALSSEGGLRDCLNTLDSLSSLNKVTLDNVLEAIGAANIRGMLPLLKCLSQNNIKAALKSARAIELSPESFIDTLLQAYRHCMVIKAVGDARSLVEVSEDVYTTLEEVSKTFTNSQLSTGFDILKNALVDATKVKIKKDYWLDFYILKLTEKPTESVQIQTPPSPILAEPVEQPKESLTLSEKIASGISQRILANYVKQASYEIIGTKMVIKAGNALLKKRLSENLGEIAAAIKTALNQDYTLEVC